MEEDIFCLIVYLQLVILTMRKYGSELKIKCAYRNHCNCMIYDLAWSTYSKDEDDIE